MFVDRYNRSAAVEGTARVSAFSDAVYAIVSTLLVLELRVPIVQVASTENLLYALKDLLPEFAAFAFSFFILMIYWVNHHHFFDSIQKTDWRLLWFNSFHLFWIATIPFTAAFIGRYPTATVPVVVYAADMVMAAFSIMLMARYVFFNSDLMYSDFPQQKKKSEFKRGMMSIYLNIIAVLLGFINVYLTLGVLILTPILFTVPRLLPRKRK